VNLWTKSVDGLGDAMIAIVDYGLGNLKSVKSALDRLGVDGTITSEAAAVLAADGVIFPGVGAFQRAMENLGRLGLVEPLRQVAASGTPFLGICLGLQLLFRESSEHGRHEGLAILPGTVTRFGVGDLKVPHMGWNEVKQERPSPIFAGIPDGRFFYFAHSYFAQPGDPDVVVGSTEYGVRFASAVQRGSVFATQFHPEKSGPAGLRMLENFCRLCRGAAPSPSGRGRG
jgi:glutamine amidotransferase